MNHLHGTPDYFKSYFTDFSTNPWKPVLWTVAILSLTHYIIIHGVRNGIERASKIMMPALFVLLVAIVVASCLLPGASKGVEFLLKPDFSKVTGDVFLGALGQSFYSMSIAMGCICTYASYYSRHTKLLNSAVQIGIIDTCVAILAGLMIFPAAFSVGVSPDSGPSLIFITLPNVFEQAFASMPIVGYIISMAFYLLLSMAALTSLISLHEVSTAFFQEELHISRPRAAMIVTAGCSLIGAVCSLSLGEWSFLKVAGVDLFDVFDFVTGQIFLPIGGLLTCLFIGWYIPKKLVKDEFTNWGTTRGIFFGTYYFLIRFVCPLAILAIFLHQLGVF
jgi:transporter